MALRCVIVDDNASFVDAARRLLEKEGVDVLGTASRTDDALGDVRALAPDVVLVDIDLGAESGFDLARRLVAAMGDEAPPVVLISTHAETDFAELIADGPAAGFVSKSALSRRAIEDVLSASRGT